MNDVVPRDGHQEAITPRSRAVAMLGLGANLGEPENTLRQACQQIALQRGIFETRSAPLYCSTPVDAPGPNYVNTVVQIQTTLSPLALLDCMQSIEYAFGRRRSIRNAPRTLDIDLLWYDDLILTVPRLTLPHPRMHERSFVLQPLVELVGKDFQIKGHKAWQWLEDCRDQTCVRLTSAA